MMVRLSNFYFTDIKPLSAEQNTAVLTATVNYIHKCTRFNPC